jgi:hypothetical protein
MFTKMALKQCGCTNLFCINKKECSCVSCEFCNKFVLNQKKLNTHKKRCSAMNRLKYPFVDHANVLDTQPIAEYRKYCGCTNKFCTECKKCNCEKCPYCNFLLGSRSALLTHLQSCCAHPLNHVELDSSDPTVVLGAIVNIKKRYLETVETSEPPAKKPNIETVNEDYWKEQFKWLTEEELLHNQWIERLRVDVPQ